jgi:organic hydroperoxide reductase OsmC/OhrA
MSTYEATVEWHIGAEESFETRKYSRAHRWKFDGGADVPASASPAVVGTVYSDPAGVDPEEALVAALASCHMLFFLDLASRSGVSVTSYVDHAVGVIGKRDDGVVAMLSATMRPQVSYAAPVDDAKIAGLHHKAHELCYIANSVNFPVSVEPAQ